MNLRRVYAIFLRQLYLTTASPTRFINIFTWILIDIFLWGFTTRYLQGVSSTLDFTTLFLGAVVLWGVLSQVQRGFILAGLEDVYTRNYLNLFASPLRVSEYLLGLVLSAIASSLVAVTVVLVICAAIFHFSVFSFGAALVPFGLTLVLFGVALGILATAIVLRVGPAGEWLAWPIPAFISPFVGIFYPVSILQHWMQVTSVFLAPSYVFDTMRAIVTGAPASIPHAWIGVALALVYVFAASLVYLRVFRFALRHGLIARYSAESYSS